MAELKTKKNSASPKDFIAKVPDEQKRKDSLELLKIFSEVTKEKPTMWGSSIIGFGQYHYKSERSSQEGDWLLTGFSPRKQNLTLYIMFRTKKLEELLKKLGPHKASVGCVYLKRLADVNIQVLKQIIKLTHTEMKKQHKA